MEWQGVPIELRFASVNGIRVRYADAGPADGPLVLFCHGWPESWYSWRHQIAALAKHGFHCIAPDMRGYGGTTAPGGRGRLGYEQYNIASLCGDAIGLIHHCGYERAILCGHDWFAAISVDGIVTAWFNAGADGQSGSSRFAIHKSSQRFVVRSSS